MKSVKVLKQIPTDLEPSPITVPVRCWDDRISAAKSDDELTALKRECAWCNVIRDDGHVVRHVTSAVAPIPTMTTLIAITNDGERVIQSGGVYRGTFKSGAWYIVDDELGEIRALRANQTDIYIPVGDE